MNGKIINSVTKVASCWLFLLNQYGLNILLSTLFSNSPYLFDNLGVSKLRPDGLLCSPRLFIATWTSFLLAVVALNWTLHHFKIICLLNVLINTAMFSHEVCFSLNQHSWYVTFSPATFMVNPDPGFDLASNRNLHVPIVLKSGSLNPLEPSGPFPAYTTIVLPFTFMVKAAL